jgi:hypothetical protein
MRLQDAWQHTGGKRASLSQIYLCSTYARSGKNNPYGCGCHAVPQDLLVDVLVRKLQEGVLSSGNLDRLRDALRRQLTQTTGTSLSKIAELRKQLGELDRDIDQAANNFLRAPAEVLDLVGAKLTALKRQREHVQNALRAAEAAGRPIDVEAEIEAAVGHLWRLGEKRLPRQSRLAAGRSSANWSRRSNSALTKYRGGREPSSLSGREKFISGREKFISGRERALSSVV